MDKSYKELPFNCKISINISLDYLVARFYLSYNGDFALYSSDEQIINDLYFYWIRTSVTNSYLWSQTIDIEHFFSPFFSNPIKIKIKQKLYRHLFIKRNPL